ncbi:hypothetical protein CKF54_03905, partial [Psittacicella hinzii]
MFVLYPSGGLGNQMFMIASTYAMAKALGQRWYVYDQEHSLIQGRTLPNYINNIFWQVPLATPERIAVINEQIDNLGVESTLLLDYPGEHCFFKIEVDKEQIYVIVDSHLMSYKYFDQYKQDIVNLFSLPPQEQEKLNSLLQECQIGKQIPTVSLHVRRGDYLSLSETHRVMEVDYYSVALAQFKDLEQFQVLVFSDDLAWCRENLVYPANCQQARYVTEQVPDYLAMLLMSRCEHNIVSNSTFSWWAGYLNPNANARVVIPERWFNSPTLKNDKLLVGSFIILSDEQIRAFQ